MGKMLSELVLRHPDFNKYHVDQKLELPKLKIDFKKYQNPEEADQVMSNFFFQLWIRTK